ncbi:MAG: hypothetical protein ACKPJJ_36540 [Planctomycetaceae bacterium]
MQRAAYVKGVLEGEVLGWKMRRGCEEVALSWQFPLETGVYFN